MNGHTRSAARTLPAFGTLLSLAVLLCLLSCQQGCPVVNVVLPNYLPILVGPQNSPFTTPNIPFVSVTVCTPGTTNCQTIDNIQLDTGSPGLRVFSQALTIPLPTEQSGGNPIAECVSFGVGNAWGSVATASVVLGSEPAVTVPIQIIDSNFGTSSPPDACSSGLFTSPSDMSANGLLGVMPFFRVWPRKEPDAASTASAGQSGTSGTGFVLNKSGLIATNWHVVADAKHITFAFPGWNEAVPADVVIRDVVNDLAILRATDLKKLSDTCSAFPYQLSSSHTITLGQHISTVGYPLRTVLGSNPKYSEGVVSSKSGMQDDPRAFQISAQVQPGSSGSPLFDADGNIIGVIVATLDAGKLYQSANVLPQNVNWAIKSDYLLNLLEMLPGESTATRSIGFSPERAAQCVASISAW